MKKTLIIAALASASLAAPASAYCPRNPYTGEPDRNCIYREIDEGRTPGQQMYRYQPFQPSRQTVCETRPAWPSGTTATCREQ